MLWHRPHGQGVAGPPRVKEKYFTNAELLFESVLYDCLTHSESDLRYLIDTVGVDKVVFGTDWPADMQIDWPVSWVLGLQSLTLSEKESILHKNLETLLNL